MFGDSSGAGLGGGAATGATIGSSILPGIGTAVGALGGALVGAAGSYFSGRSSSDAARKQYKKRYQWTVDDLRKAGLNPMLAVQNSPGTPAQPQFENIGEGAVRGFSAQQQAKLIQEQITLARGQNQKTLEEARGIKQNNDIVEASPLYQGAIKAYDPETGVRGTSAAGQSEFDAKLDVLMKQSASYVADIDLKRMQEKIAKEDLTLRQVEAQFAPELKQIEQAYRQAMAEAARAGIPEATASAEFWSNAGPLGKLAVFLKGIFK